MVRTGSRTRLVRCDVYARVSIRRSSSHGGAPSYIGIAVATDVEHSATLRMMAFDQIDLSFTVSPRRPPR